MNLNGVQEVAGSNPVAPTIINNKLKHQDSQGYYLLARHAFWRVRCGLGVEKLDVKL